MADIELVIKIPKELYEAYKGRPPMLGDAGMDMIAQSIANGTPIPKIQRHVFLAVCDSDFPITEEVIDDLKSTVFVGNEKCSYCFEIIEVIEPYQTESEE